MHLNYVEGEVVSRVDGEKRAVKAAKCPCGSIGFALYWLFPDDDDPREHLHLQCLACDESYCQAGECK